MSGERYTTEKSTLKKKPEWGGALVGHHHHQQHVHFLHPQQQNLQQTQQPYAPHQRAHVGGCLDGTTFQSDVGISCEETLFANPNAIVDAHSVRHACHFNAAAEGSTNCDDVDVGTAHMRSTSAPQKQQNFGMAAPDASTKKSSINIAAKGPAHRAKSVRDHVGCIGQDSLSMSTPIKMPTPRRPRNVSMSSLTVRPTGTKDRHSKVRTAKGLRDRRVRLSAPTAIQFFDVQDRLGYDQPSKAVDWLIKKARAAIDELAPVEAVIAGDETTDVPARERKVRKDHHDGSLVKVKDEEQSMPLPSGGGVRAESRAKARERARERAKEKGVTSCAISSPAATSGHEVTATSAATTPMRPFVPSASSNLNLSLPEFFLLSSQLRQPFDDQQCSVDLSSMLSQPSPTALAPHFPPLSSHFFPCPSQSSASAFVHPGVDLPLSFQFSAPPIYTNTPISPRGTLQSIFSNPASFSMQPHMPMAQRSMSMMGSMQQAHMCGTVLNSVREDTHDNMNEEVRQRSAELGSPDLHQHSRIPMRIHGMEVDSHVEETRIATSSRQADFQ